MPEQEDVTHLHVAEHAVASPSAQGQPQAGLAEIISVVADRVDPLLKLVTEIASQRLNAGAAEAKFRIQMSWIAVFLVTLIVGTAALLTYLNRIDGSTFTFLLGLTIGYLLTFIRDAIAPPSE